MHVFNFSPIRIARLLATVSLFAVAGCDRLKHDLLAAPDPDVIDPKDVNTPEGADALRVGALGRLRSITAGSGAGDSPWMFSGLLTDEWKSGDTFSQRNETDQRLIQTNNGNLQTVYRDIHRARNSAREALNALLKYKPSPAYLQGQMYFVMGFAEMSLAEMFCNGQPLSDASTGFAVYGPPLENVQIYQIALAHFDSAVTLAATAAGTADSTRADSVRRSAAIGKARVLLDLGGYERADLTNADLAAVAVANVPDNFQLRATFSLTSGSNQIWSLNTSAKRWVVGDSFDVGGRIQNALPFASAGDPRVPVTGTSTGTSPAGKSFDGATNFIRQNLFGRTDPTPIVSGLDARLIQAEVRLQHSDIAGMMTILNALRASARNLGAVTTPVMAALPTPASQAEAVDLFFREKAFWTFGRGQRLGDLRRLIRQYGRAAATVFPTGQFFKGGSYGPDVNFPATVDELNNPQFTGCKDRNA
jgi:hypothetical protein